MWRAESKFLVVVRLAAGTELKSTSAVLDPIRGRRLGKEVFQKGQVHMRSGEVIAHVHPKAKFWFVRVWLAASAEVEPKPKPGAEMFGRG